MVSSMMGMSTTALVVGFVLLATLVVAGYVAFRLYGERQHHQDGAPSQARSRRDAQKRRRLH